MASTVACASKEALEAAIAHRTQRISGLYRALWGVTGNAPG